MTTRLIFPMGNSIVFESRTLGSSRNLLGPRRRLGRGAPSDERQGHSPPELFLSGRQWLAYTREGADGHSAEIWTAPVEGDHDHPRLGNAELFLRAPVFVSQAAFSPDRRWLAYSSSETRRNEVYVRPFSRAESARGGRSQISTAGGRFPIWARGAHGSGASCSSLVSMGAS